MDRNIDAEFCRGGHSSLPPRNRLHAPYHRRLQTAPFRKYLRKFEIEKSLGGLECRIQKARCQRSCICQLNSTVRQIAANDSSFDTVAARLSHFRVALKRKCSVQDSFSRTLASQRQERYRHAWQKAYRPALSSFCRSPLEYITASCYLVDPVFHADVRATQWRG